MPQDDILESAIRYPIPDDCDRLAGATQQEETRRQLADLQIRVRHLEQLVHRLLNESQGDGR